MYNFYLILAFDKYSTQLKKQDFNYVTKLSYM